MRHRRRKRGVPATVWALVALLACLGSVPRRSLAQETSAAAPTDPAGYRELVDEAVREFAAHNYAESRSLFRRAHALYPNARTYRGLGLAEFELRNYGECIRHFESALESAVKPLTSELRADTERMLTRANTFVARVLLEAKPPVARVVVDGLLVEDPTGRSLVLEMGDHTLEVQAPGFVTEVRKLSVQGGEDKTLSVVLSPTSATASEPTEKPRRWYKSPWLWAGIGVVVVGAAAGAGYALTREAESAPASGGSAGVVIKGP